MKFGSSPLDLLIIGRSVLSSQADATAELYRGLINELAQQGHRTTFLERIVPGQQVVKDMLRSPYCQVWTYRNLEDLQEQYRLVVQSADVVMMGSGVDFAEDIAIFISEEAKGITIYYDSNLGRTVSSLEAAEKVGDCLSCRTIGNFNLFLSTTGGTALEKLARENDIAFARPLYESVDPYSFYRTDGEKTYDLGFIGNYKSDRSEKLNQMLLGPARFTPNRKFSLAGGGYLVEKDWPPNLTYLEYLPETNLVDYYNRQHCSLVISRGDRGRMGYTPTRRLLAAAACGVPVLSDYWEGLDDFLEPNREVYCVATQQDVLDILYGTDEYQRRKLGGNARKRILEQHTISHRAEQLLGYLEEVTD